MLRRARRDKREGKAPSTQAGEFIREEIEHIREGKHGARSSKQAIAIGLSKARRAGVELPPPKKGSASEKTRKAAADEDRKNTKVTRASRVSRRTPHSPPVSRETKDSCHREIELARSAVNIDSWRERRSASGMASPC
jgi:hypothetical protein